MASEAFDVLRLVGEGSTSQVWEAVDINNERVALKVARDEAYTAVLAEEAERLLLVGSPRLPQVRAAGRWAWSSGPLVRGAAYVALDWVSGAAIDPVHIDDSSRTGMAWTVARDVATALADLHAAGAAHGDVKPANILTDHFRAVLVDLGLGDGVEARLPRGGTRRYLAPEVFESGQTGDAGARDVWALGVTLAEIASPRAAAAEAPHLAWQRVELTPSLRSLLEALLAPQPAARPLAHWVEQRARVALHSEPTAEEVFARRRAFVKRSYLALRRHEILAAARSQRFDIEVAGLPGEWLANTTRLAHSIALLRSTPPSNRTQIAEMTDTARTKWLLRLVGPTAAAWPLRFASDHELAARLLELVETQAPAALTLNSFTTQAAQSSKRRATSSVTPPPTPTDLALALGRGTATAADIDAAEQLVLASDPLLASLGVALGRVLRLRGELGRALAVLRFTATPEARVEAAETARRARDIQLCRTWLSQVSQDAHPTTWARREAIAARLDVDQGNPDQALARLDRVTETAPSLEVRALALVLLGDRAGAREALERSHALARDDEERSRLAGVAATLAHANGDMEAALSAFRQAAGYAGRAGAVLEEATYLTGVSAAASVVGEVGEALSAAHRSMLLFEHLGRGREVARAMLTRAATFAQIGATPETREAASTAISLARASGDRVCQAYAHLALADVLPSNDRDGLEHAIRAQSLVEESTVDDQLRVAARLMLRGGDVDRAAWDAVASRSGTAVDARVEWWGARARDEQRTPGEMGAAIVTELSGADLAAAPLGVRGPALAAGAELAAAIGDGDGARRLASAAASAARELLAKVPPELRGKLADLDWVGMVQSPREASLAPEQLTDIETLVHALARRDRLRPLLDQVLDALVLWTGVERGLLLLRAPEGRLVARAARNLARSDLVGAQQELSHSLAERAMQERAPVVAVDAAGELPEVHASVHALKLRSVLAVPLVSRGEVLGVVYLDDRVRRGAFGPRELAWVRLVATLAAVAIVDARDQLLLRRAARRARRAEARLANELAKKKAELDVAQRELARAARDTRFSYDAIVGQSEPLRSMLRLVDRVTTTDVPVLVIGESGSGKELVARAIHHNGERANRPFVSENCGAIPEPLLESALFGHVRGAFTGANRQQAGLFEVADGGTLFLDEIGEMSLGMQTKLLRVLESGEVRPVGSTRDRVVDVRMIGATHRDLEQLVATGAFREDLYYRLNVIAIRVPSLRERPGDVELLVRHFLEKHGEGHPRRISAGALAALRAFEWPGNVRQLENEVRRALVLADALIDVEHLSPIVARRGGGESLEDAGLNVRRRVDALEADLVREALERTRGNQTRAAELLGLSRYGLQKMMKRLAIPLPSRARSTERAS